MDDRGAERSTASYSRTPGLIARQPVRRTSGAAQWIPAENEGYNEGIIVGIGIHSIAINSLPLIYREEGGHALAHIPYVPYDEAEGRLAHLYRRYGGPEMAVDNIIRIHSLNPPSMEHHGELYGHLMRGPSPLSRIQREMIAVTVSAVNDCFY